MKHPHARRPSPHAVVAPLAGAWIETVNLYDDDHVSVVAPLAGAWIETVLIIILLTAPPSRPSRARGLKHGATGQRGQRGHVAPLAGAWIETTPPARRLRRGWSRPSRARGLKLDELKIIYDIILSRPSRARGLKLREDLIRQLPRVAPLAGAWIETAPA